MDRSRETSDGRLELEHEQRLIKAAQGGCARSAHRLVEAHQERLNAFVWRMIHDRHDSEEICQEAFLRAFAALDSFDFSYRFSTWLFTIAYRLCLNQIRRRKDYAGDVDFAAMSSANRDDAADDVGVADAVVNTEEARRLKDVIWDSVDRLSPHQRAAVLLFYREQMSCQQIGEVLDMPPATVKSHLHRARARLKDMLSAELVEDWTNLRFATGNV